MPESPFPHSSRDLFTLENVSLSEGTYIIGRSRSADYYVSDPNASRRHARVSISGNEMRIEDLGSKNGTLVNGVRLVGARVLRDGDQVTIGSQQLTLRLATSTEAEAASRNRVVAEAEWGQLSDQTERTLDLLDVLLTEQVRGSEQARALAHLVVTSVDEVLDTVGATRPSLTPRQAYRLGRMIGAIGARAYSPAILAWQANARRRLDSLRQHGSYSAA